ncbi:hypothetical protein EV379_2816 [Microterricola gilva]|uniref:Uncharacterized protein n=2 Tax=Microterricola gilva TaxID=393267 RepID=A0A4Q8AQY7_9MICO|nr:hypothetical protein EV379_2816 [Microterricola gilva]
MIVLWVWGVVGLLVAGAAWLSSVMITYSMSDSGYKASRLERKFAKLPGWIRRIPTRSLPESPMIGRSWDQFFGGHEVELRLAHKGHQGLSALPAILAWLTFLLGVLQLVVISVAFFFGRPDHWLLLSVAFSIAALGLLALDLFLQRKRWNSRAPFEWRFAAAAVLVANQQRDEEGPGLGMDHARKRLAGLELLEHVLADRIQRPESRSAHVAATKWEHRTRPLSDALASARLSSIPSGLPRTTAWIESAAHAIVVPVTRASMWSRLALDEDPSARAIRNQKTPADRAAVWFLYLSFGIAAGLGLMFYATLVLNGEVAALEFEAIAPWLNSFVGVATVVGVVISARHQIRRN